MERFEHGGNIYAYPGVLDFSASLNPLGMPSAARQALREGVDAFEAYPDPACGELVSALAAHEQVPREWVLVCAGATDAFARLCQSLSPTHALVCAPCYSGYEQALAQQGAVCEVHPLREEDGFAVGPDFAHRIDAGTDLVFLANPNNPTGRCLQREVVTACLEAACRVGAVVVLDECFIDLAEGEGSVDLLGCHPNLVVVKAFTKTYALAGLRLGYALCSDEALLARLRAAGQPWAVSTPAQVAGIACLKEEGYLAQSRRLVARERGRLDAALRSCGLQVVRSEANYLLFKAQADLTEALVSRNILVRSCQNFVGLDERWHRIAVRKPKENDRLIRALEEVVPCVQGR